MSKTEIWVIQRDDGYFYYDYDFIMKYPYEEKPRFTKDIHKVFLNNKFWYKVGCEREIKGLNLKNCRPVKVEIRVVGEYYENIAFWNR